MKQDMETGMPLAKHYDPKEIEPQLRAFWEGAGIYRFALGDERPVFSIDTPPPTVSGNLHLGHTYSYTHADVFARFHRMRGENVFYPMGFDDNGLPTERLVESQLGITATEIGRSAFIEKCLRVSEDLEQDYQELWQRLGLSIDWDYTYRTIDDYSRKTSQRSFIELFQNGLVYRQEAPTIWCPTCHTGIAQADVNDLERESQLVTLAFGYENGEALPIATTRPELLPACVAIFVHPGDERYQDFLGQQVSVPLFDQEVTILQDPMVDPEKGSGAVMCCTFGDTVDKHWWYTHHLDHIKAIDQQGNLTEVAGEFAGLPVKKARQAILDTLNQQGYVLDRQPTTQIVPVHERCDSPVEYIMSQQWFIRLLDFKEELLAAGDQIKWHPAHMKARYLTWVENLAWDWCISRQRYFGVPFPLWYCQECGDVYLADIEQLPVDPSEDHPKGPCSCGSKEFTPEEDVFDTWATSSMTPQIVGRWLCDDEDKQDDLYQQVYPFALRPQAHEIIRTWAFYTIAKSHFHFKQIPWNEVAISGWGIAGEGMGKISKSRGGGPLSPLEMIESYSADAVRYWATSTGLGKDAVISEEKIQLGAKLITKLWNVARFSERFLEDFDISRGVDLTSNAGIYTEHLSPADRWILSRSQRLVRRVTHLLEKYDYAAAKSEIENFFWRELADNYLEMCKQRLYGEDQVQRQAARAALYNLLLTTIKLMAPFLPYVTEAIYQGIFAKNEPQQLEDVHSIHTSTWPVANNNLEDEFAELVGATLVEIAISVRRFKSENGIALGTEIQRLQLSTTDDQLAIQLERASNDLISITRAREIDIGDHLDQTLTIILDTGKITVAIEL
jgi:valyl-tRNA synthetase